MAVAALKKLEDQLKCHICLDTYTDPKQLQCLHVFCRECLVKLVVRDPQRQLVLTCPSCSQVTPVTDRGVAGLRAAFNVNRFVDIIVEHNQAREGALHCAVHPERELELYCETCETFLCLECTIKEHRGHKYNLVKDVFENHAQDVIASLAPAELQLTAVYKALEQVDTREKAILNQQATLEAKIHKESQQLIDAIKSRTDEHISKLRLITEQKLRDLASQREQIETTKTQLSSYLDMVRETLKSGGQEEAMKTAISKQLKEINDSFQTDLLEPTTQADMEFFTSKFQECRSYGEVGVIQSPHFSKCLVTGENLEVATLNKQASVIFQAFNFMDQPCPEQVKSLHCQLVSEMTGIRVRGSIERIGQNQYRISYQPTIKGRHQLHIKAEGQHIRGSPFNVMVNCPIEQLGTQLLTIGWVNGPWGVAINKKGEVVVTERDGHCVSVFSPGGEKLQSFGTYGSDQSQFEDPTGVAVDGEGNILVGDCGNHRIQKFTADGQFLTAVGTEGSGPLQFSCLRGITVNSSNNKVYVADGANCRIQVLNSDLTFFSIFGKKGSGKGQFDYPMSIACDSTGNVYVTDCLNNRIQVFTAEGKFLRLFGRQFRSMGSGKLSKPVGIAIDTSDMVYVTDSDNNHVCIFASDGHFVTSFGNEGKAPGQFQAPRGVAVGNSGIVCVCDYDNTYIPLF